MRQERFTEQAQEVLGASQQLVSRFRNSMWDVEHIFLALLEQQNGLAAEILKRLNVNLTAMKKRVADVLGTISQDCRAAPQLHRRRADLPDAQGGAGAAGGGGRGRPFER